MEGGDFQAMKVDRDRLGEGILEDGVDAGDRFEWIGSELLLHDL